MFSLLLDIGTSNQYEPAIRKYKSSLTALYLGFEESDIVQ